MSTCSYLLMLLLTNAVTNLRIFHWGGSYFYKFVFTGYGILILLFFDFFNTSLLFNTALVPQISNISLSTDMIMKKLVP